MLKILQNLSQCNVALCKVVQPTSSFEDLVKCIFPSCIPLSQGQMLQIVDPMFKVVGHLWCRYVTSILNEGKLVPAIIYIYIYISL